MRERERSWLAYFAVAVMVVGGVPAISGEGPDLVVPGISIPDEIRDYRLLRIDTEAASAAARWGTTQTLRLGDQETAIRLWKTDLFGPGMKTPEGVVTYEGEVVGETHSVVRLTAYDGGVSGYVALPEGRVWGIEKASYYDASAPRGWHVVYPLGSLKYSLNVSNDAVYRDGGPGPVSKDVQSRIPPSRTHSDGIRVKESREADKVMAIERSDQDADHQYLGDKAVSQTVAGPVVYTMLKLGIYADTDFKNAYSDWQPRLIALVNSANGYWMSEAGVRLEIFDGPLEIPGSGSWTADSYGLLNAFTSWCQGQTTTCLTTQVAHMATAKTLTGTACGNVGCSWVGSREGISKQNCCTEALKVLLFVHEAGHNMDVDTQHTYSQRWWDGLCQCYMSTVCYGTLSAETQGWFSWINRRIVVSEARWKSSYLIAYLGSSATNSHGLKVESWKVMYPELGLASTVVDKYVKFELVNTLPDYVYLQSIFVGCRNPNWCDWGWTPTVTLEPWWMANYKYSYSNFRSMNVGGRWDVWPTYQKTNGIFGPSMWEVVKVPIQTTMLSCCQPPTSTDTNGVESSGFRIYAPSASPRVGNTLTLIYNYRNLKFPAADLDFEPTGVFIVCIKPSGGHCDSPGTTLRIRYWDSTQFIWTFVPTETGTYLLAPAYYMNGNWWPGWPQSQQSWVLIAP